MHARYYTSRVGRFVSVDRARTASLARPQVWNRYAYVQNNPISFADPDGLSRKRVHAYHTREVLAARGFSTDQIDRVVAGNLRADAFFGQRLLPRFHATALFLSDTEANARGGRVAKEQLERAIALAARGKDRRALRALGRAFHAAEDQVAHRGLGNLLTTVFSKDRLRQHENQDQSVVIDDDGELVSVEDPAASRQILETLTALLDEFVKSDAERD
jgi:hypothetical protein